MKPINAWIVIIVLSLSAACGSPAANLPVETIPEVAATAMPPEPSTAPTEPNPTGASALSTAAPSAAASGAAASGAATSGAAASGAANDPTPTPTGATLSEDPFRFSEPGQYFVGYRTFKFDKEIRAGQKVSVTVWYPALKPDGFTGSAAEDAAPDLSAAPYPLILSSAEMAGIFAPHMASHGFIAAGVNNQWTYMTFPPHLISYPQEIVYALDRMATGPLDGLEGMVDGEHAGAMGYSFDGTTSMFLAGARVDPASYLGECAKNPPQEETVLGGLVANICALTNEWDDFTARAGDAADSDSADGLWQPITDERIRAVAPMAAEGAWLFGERGLAAVDRPVLMLAGSDDWGYRENAWMFDRLGSADRTFITFMGKTHIGMFDDEPLGKWKHILTAFFGYHLQGKEDYQYYFSQEFIDEQEGLAWGVK